MNVLEKVPRGPTFVTLLLIAAILQFTGCAGPVSHVEILAAIKPLAPGRAWHLEGSAYRELGKVLFGPGQHVVVTPLSDLSATEPSIFDEDIGNVSLIGKNPMQLREEAAKIRTKFHHAFSQLAMRRIDRRRTEIISAVVASAWRFRDDPRGTEKVLIILSTGFEQSGLLNMGDVSLNLRAESPYILRALRRRGLVPSLVGVKVCMIGITAGQNGLVDTNTALAVRSFWDSYFRAAGAQLIDFSPTISATCLKSVRRSDIFAESQS